MKITNNDCSILVCSCDKYEDTWKPFFTLFNKYWNECPYKVYLNTESKKYVNDKTSIYVSSLNNDTPYWSLRLKRCLEQIDSKFIIIMLDDFFLLSKVNQEIVDKCLYEISNKNDIASICFERNGNPDAKKYFDYFTEREKGSRYRLNCQITLWRKDILHKCLMDFENPWEFEEIGNLRSNVIQEKFYVQAKGTKPIFDYEFNVKKGYGLYRGKWLISNIDLFKKEGIFVDFSNLGFFYSKDQFIVKKRKFKNKLIYYANNICEIFLVIENIMIKQYKKMYWFIEKIKYHKYI